MDGKGILEKLSARFGDTVVSSNVEVLQPFAVVATDQIAEVGAFL